MINDINYGATKYRNDIDTFIETCPFSQYGRISRHQLSRRIIDWNFAECSTALPHHHNFTTTTPIAIQL